MNIIVYKYLGDLLELYPEGTSLAEGKMKQKVQAFLIGISILSNCPPLRLSQFVLLPAVFGSACFPTNSPALGITKVSHFCQSDRWTMVFYCCFDLYFFPNLFMNCCFDLYFFLNFFMNCCFNLYFFMNCIFSCLWTIYLCWSYWIASSCPLSVFFCFPYFYLIDL